MALKSGAPAVSARSRACGDGEALPAIKARNVDFQLGPMTTARPNETKNSPVKFAGLFSIEWSVRELADVWREASLASVISVRTRSRHNRHRTDADPVAGP
jgi:hypothetical protein